MNTVNPNIETAARDLSSCFGRYYEICGDTTFELCGELVTLRSSFNTEGPHGAKVIGAYFAMRDKINVLRRAMAPHKFIADACPRTWAAHVDARDARVKEQQNNEPAMRDAPTTTQQYDRGIIIVNGKVTNRIIPQPDEISARGWVTKFPQSYRLIYRESAGAWKRAGWAEDEDEPSPVSQASHPT